MASTSCWVAMPPMSHLLHDPVPLDPEVDGPVGGADARFDDAAGLEVLLAPRLQLEEQAPARPVGQELRDPLLGRRGYGQGAARGRPRREEIAGVEVLDARQLGER